MDLTFSASLLARENSEERNDECDNQERHHVVVGLTAANRLDCLLVESHIRHIAKIKIKRKRLRDHVACRIGAWGQIRGGHEGMRMNRSLLRCERDGLDAYFLTEL